MIPAIMMTDHDIERGTDYRCLACENPIHGYNYNWKMCPCCGCEWTQCIDAVKIKEDRQYERYKKDPIGEPQYATLKSVSTYFPEPDSENWEYIWMDHHWEREYDKAHEEYRDNPRYDVMKSLAYAKSMGEPNHPHKDHFGSGPRLIPWSIDRIKIEVTDCNNKVISSRIVKELAGDDYNKLTEYARQFEEVFNQTYKESGLSIKDLKDLMENAI